MPSARPSTSTSKKTWRRPECTTRPQSCGLGCPPSFYQATLEAFASFGYVVLAQAAGQTGKGLGDPWCENEWEDQQRVIAYANESRGGDAPLPFVDWSRRVGVVGHSMGAHATVRSAGASAAALGVGAAVAYAPQFFGGDVPSYSYDVSVPIFYVSGSKDGIVSPWKVTEEYEKTPAKVL